MMNSPFTNIPNEVLFQILYQLSYADRRHPVLANAIPLKLHLAHRYWKRRLLIDMPGLWDIPALPQECDYFGLYQELRRQCFATSGVVKKEGRGLVLGTFSREARTEAS